MKFFLGVVLVLALILFFLPAMLSISQVHQFILTNFVSGVSVKRLRVSWFEDSIIEGLVVQDSEKRTLFTSERVVHTKPLLSWIRDPQTLGTLTLEKPVVWLDTDDNDEIAISVPKNSYTFTLEVVDGTINRADERLSDLHFVLSGALRDATLFLTKPFEAHFAITHAKEVRLSVADHGFRLPLSPFSIANMALPAVTLDPGIVTAHNVGFLGTIISLLKFRPTSNGEVTMWFTPLYLEMKEGIVTCKRTDILVASSFPVALWGTVDLVKDRVDMTLGLSSQTLRRAFALLTLSSNYFVLIPIRGTVASPRADTALATTRITALRLQETLSPTSIIFGSLLGLATRAIDNPVVVPPPTTTPFPWARNN